MKPDTKKTVCDLTYIVIAVQISIFQNSNL